MKSPTQVLLDFVSEAKFEQLPPEVVHESKRIFLDSIGVGLAALKTDKGLCGIELAKRFGKADESTILGVREKVSCGAAAFANSELINAMDFDPAIFPTHAPPAIIPASLALGESVGALGKDIVLSIAMGCEVSLRLGKALRGMKKVFTTQEGGEIGKITNTKHSISAINVAVIAGAAGSIKVSKLDPDKIPHAVGLAAHFTPIPQQKWKILKQLPMPKYLCAGWALQAEVYAVLLADMGYTTDTTPLDGELGFWRFFGSDSWDPDVLTENLGREWKMLQAVEYKPYPCCRDFHVSLDCFTKIIEENEFLPKDIKSVKILTHPSVEGDMYKVKRIRNHVDTQFSLPYVISAAAHRVSLAEWQDPDTLSDSSIINFMDKVSQGAHPDFVKVQGDEPLSNMTTVELNAKGKIFKAEGKYPKGLPKPDFARMTDEDLLRKFKVNATKVLPREKVDAVVAYLMNLERGQNISDLVKLTVP